MISEQALQRAAKDLGCSLACIKAVAEVEGGHGFLPDGRPVVLFEAHIFSKLTNHDYDKTNPNISSKSWNRSLYAKGKDWIVRGEKEQARLAEASKLDRNKALESCSWGLFQVMGFNWEDLGYLSLQQFVNLMYKSEDDHLEAFVRFVKYKRLDKHLRNLNFALFAKGYNGPSYRENKYDERLMKAYVEYST